LPACNKIINGDAVRMGRFHDIKELVLDILHVDLRANNFEGFSADGPKKVVYVQHG
jgi:hypothetical protein